MTTDRDQLREALMRADKAATPGPWYRLDPPWIDGDVETTIMSESPDPHVARFICDFDFAGMFDDDDGKKSDCPDADADLILLLRNSLPTILAALDPEVVKAETIEQCAQVAESAFDDRPRSRVGHPSHMDWEDGYREGTQAAASAIRARKEQQP